MDCYIYSSRTDLVDEVGKMTLFGSTKYIIYLKDPNKPEWLDLLPSFHFLKQQICPKICEKERFCFKNLTVNLSHHKLLMLKAFSRDPLHAGCENI